MKDYIPFYGTEDRELFEIERYSMDRSGKVIAHLDSILPKGRVLDIGAGNGFTAEKLCLSRQMICVEPSPTLPDFGKPVTWVRATAETLPFHDGYFDAAYSTWAYFLSGINKLPGLQQASRCIRDHGVLAIVDNAGNDEFTSFASAPISADSDWYLQHGFNMEIIETAFEFNNLEDAKKLMTAFFGPEAMKNHLKLTYAYKVAVFTKTIHKNKPSEL